MRASRSASSNFQSRASSHADPATSGLKQCRGGPRLGGDGRAVSVGQLGAKTRLTGKQLRSLPFVDAAGQPGDDRFAVLSDHQGASFLEPSDLFQPEDRNVLSGDGAAGHGAGLPVGSGNSGLADLVGDLGVLEWLGMVRLWRVGQERPAVLSRLAAVLEAPDPDFAIVTPVARARSRLITRRHVRAGVIATQVLPIVDVLRLVEPGRVLDLVPCTVDVHLLLG